jgi:hypothetical protein
MRCSKSRPDEERASSKAPLVNVLPLACFSLSPAASLSSAAMASR